MHFLALYVGGPFHGQTTDVNEDMKVVTVEDPEKTGSARHQYEVRRWQGVDAAHGFDRLLVSFMLEEAEFKSALEDALKIAADRKRNG